MKYNHYYAECIKVKGYNYNGSYTFGILFDYDLKRSKRSLVGWSENLRGKGSGGLE